MAAAPRLVVLDNDATTGSFYELFAWYEWLIESRLAPYLSMKELVAAFMHILEIRGNFRPGLPRFLRRLTDLKERGLLDYVVMYTNQSESAPIQQDKKGAVISVPRLLEGMYNLLGGDNCLIDLRLIRPHKFDESNKYLRKSFDRIFEALELPKPWSARNTLFFDDMPKGDIEAIDVRHIRSAHVSVRPYTKSYDGRTVYDLLVETIRNARRNKVPQALEERAYGLVHKHVISMANVSLNEIKHYPPITWTTYGQHLELFGDEDD